MVLHNEAGSQEMVKHADEVQVVASNGPTEDTAATNATKPAAKNTTTSADKVYWQWHEGEVIASFLAFDAASRQKQTSTRLFRAQFAQGCFSKFAKKLVVEGIWDPNMDIVKSAELRCKFTRTGKNAGESAAFRKIAEVKREIVNVILPIFLRLTPQGVPPSGVQWEEVMLLVKKEY